MASNSNSPRGSKSAPVNQTNAKNEWTRPVVPPLKSSMLQNRKLDITKIQRNSAASKRRP
jgi:hypothetical protein